MTRAPFPKVADTAHERRTHIIEATAALMARAGLAGISVRSVAEHAGCSRGLVEHYFNSKAELLAAADLWVNESYLERVANAVGDRRGLAALEARLRNLLPYTESVLDEWRVRLEFWRQAGANSATVLHNSESFYAAYEQILADVRHAQAHGEIPDSVPLIESSELVLFFVIGIATACITTERLRQQRPLDRRIEMILGMLKTDTLAALRVGDPEVEF
ncbi:MAG TPA: TetR/AcrR family transcriptional regulator [Pseudomonadales bacterium]|nr:TetR/AcrR family transcriptional regulator [Pseudomonadales bacterium]